MAAASGDLWVQVQQTTRRRKCPPQPKDAAGRDSVERTTEEKLVQTQYDFLINVVHSAGEALGASGKKE